MPKTNYEIVHEMSMPELAAWVAVQIRQYYLADNTVIFEEEVQKIARTYIKWMMEDEKSGSKDISTVSHENE